MLWPNGSTIRPTITRRGGFGDRIHPITRKRKPHRGVDMVGFGMVRAVADGTVVTVGIPAGWLGGGIQVWIQHDGYFTRSLHLGSAIPKLGQKVKAGDPIGLMGSTGAVTGKHLHLELTPGRWHNRNAGQVDPVAFLAGRVGTPGGSTASTGGNTPAPITPEEEDNMQSIKVAGGKEYGIGQEFLSHYSKGAEASITRRVMSAEDELHEISQDEFLELLDGCGIPREVIDSNGYVLVPGTGIYKNGGVWSRNREILAALKVR